ncbi:MAG: ATP-binding protein [Candidatus Gracilibacteria bacterium]|nr:ATP-binding protein [Candidatus Gracilibacteria bacterium]
MQIATIVSGSTTEGLKGRVRENYSVEDLRVGQFSVIEGERARYFSMITDINLSANPELLFAPPEKGSFKARVLHGSGTYGEVTIKPMLQLKEGEDLKPVKTIPVHFSPLNVATEEDFKLVFGTEDKEHFNIGQPLDMDIPVCLNLPKFVERSNGVFGKSGTGKSFLTRLLLCATIKNNTAVNLIFDMHNEYGWESQSEGKTKVKGLRQLFPGKVKVFSLDPESSRARGVSVDSEVTIGLDQISVGDLSLLQNELGLSQAALDNAYLLDKEFGENWIRQILDTEPLAIKGLADKIGGNDLSINALKRKVGSLTNFKFLRDNQDESTIQELVNNLDKGIHVVIEFGRYRNPRAYMLVANIITRKLHELYVRKTEKHLNSGNEADRPKQLVITIEEAHKFLNTAVARYTIFGEIAREMRKYNVTLLIVDQRPSSIESEILSQIGTRVTALLNDEKDIEAVFTGVSGSRALKQILATLDSKQQALIMGHATPMPVVIRTRSYDAEFYKAIGSGEQKSEQETVQDLFG